MADPVVEYRREKAEEVRGQRSEARDREKVLTSDRRLLTSWVAGEARVGCCALPPLDVLGSEERRGIRDAAERDLTGQKNIRVFRFSFLSAGFDMEAKLHSL
jgi:hypothetical protein